MKFCQRICDLMGTKPDTPMSEKEKLPAWKTLEECCAYCEEKGDSFYLTAFLFEAWNGIICTAIMEEYAKKSGQRHLQSGIGWEAWKSVFEHAKAPEEIGHILNSLARFMHCDTPEGSMAEQVLNLLDLEDKYGAPVSVTSFLAGTPHKQVALEEIFERQQSYFQRITQWWEALAHWETHWMAAVLPMGFQGTEKTRELTHLGLMEANFAGLNDHGKEWWRFRHEALAAEFAGQPEWRLLGKAQSLEKFGELRQPEVDQLIILWWPLLTRYHWTDRDMRGLVKKVVKYPDAYPLREDKEFADYRKKALGLIKAKTRRDKSALDGKPTGWRVALAMAGKLSE